MERRYENGEALEGVQEPQQALEAHLAVLFRAGEGQDADIPEAPTPTPLPCPLADALREELREELEVANATRHDWIAQEGRQQRAVRGV